MKKLIFIVLLAAAFVGGYHLGRQPGSPDIVGWGRDVYDQASGAGQHVAAALGVDTGAEKPAR